jgi:hypothetical protein
MTDHFKKWNRRSLTTLGKIVLAKTCGLSQVIYLMQTIYVEDSKLNRFKTQLYNFIWSRCYDPEKRTTDKVKRHIVNTSISNGGYGMIDLSTLRDAITLKGLGRIIGTDHAYQAHIASNIKWDNYINPNLKVKEHYMENAIILLTNLRKKQLTDCEDLASSAVIQAAIGGIPWKDHIAKGKENSVLAFMLEKAKKTKLRDLNEADRRSLAGICNKDDFNIFNHLMVKHINQEIVPGMLPMCKNGKQGKITTITKMTSRQIREQLEDEEPIMCFRSGIILTPQESKTWGLRIRKLKAVKHRNVLLNVAHGNVYTLDRKFRYGLIDSPLCECGELDDLTHRVWQCKPAREIWKSIGIHEVETGNELMPLIGANQETEIDTLTLHAEVLNFLLNGSHSVEQWKAIHKRLMILPKDDER